MKLPLNINYPFFSYGIFKPGQLAYLQIRKYVKNVHSKCFLSGSLLIRDGLPIIDEKGCDEVYGEVIQFKKDLSGKAYNSIIEIEPGKQYKWGVGKITIEGEKQIKANVLFGRSPKKGSKYSDYNIYDGKMDPMFSDALEVIDEVVKDCNDNKEVSEYKFFFKLQMAYLLLWSVIERYVSLRYYLGTNRWSVMDKLQRLSYDPVFCSQLEKEVKEKREVYRSDKPTKREILDPQNPKKCIKYYYQLRSNIIHRGKAAFWDYERLLSASMELINIIKETINNAFRESAET